MADAPKILPTDYLDEAYPKMNLGIENANEALNRVTIAENDSAKAIEIAEQTQNGKLKLNSVSRNVLNFYEEPINVFNPATVTVGGYVNETNGVWYSSPNINYSDFIPCKEGDEIKLKFSGSVTFYNDDKVFVSGKAGNTLFIVPAGSSFFRFAVTVTNMDKQMVTINNPLPINYIPYKVQDKTLLVDENNLIGLTKKKSENKLDLSKLTPGYYETDGTWVNNGSLASTSELIDVIEGATYTQKKSANITYWTEDDVFVIGLKARTFTVPTGQGIKFVRVSVFTEDKNDAMLVEGTEYPSEYINLYNYDFSTSDYSFKRDIQKIQNDIQKIGSGQYGKLERPANGIVYFSVDINADLQIQKTENVLQVQDGEDILTDNGILWLPSNYDPKGKPLKLVIFSHGSGETIDTSRTSLPNPFNYLLRQGYAVMDMNGIPKDISGGNGIHFGMPLMLQSYVKGYHYVIDKYNIDPNGCYVTGMSVGGLGALAISQSGIIPVNAVGVFCPVTDVFKQAWLNPWTNNQRANIAKYYNFDNWDTFNGFTVSGAPTQEEIDYFMENIDKVIGYNPAMKHVYNWYSNNPYNFEVGSVEEKNAYESLVRHHTSPVKIWHNDDDNTVHPRYSDFFIKSIRNSGGLAYMRKMPSGGHNAWDNGDHVTTTDMNGATLTVRASGYELVQWFKRFI